MISKGYHYVINLRIFSNFLYQCRQDLWRRKNPNSPEFICYDRFFDKDQYRCSILIFGKRPIIKDELGGICVLLSPQIFNLIIYDEVRQGIIGTAPMKSLCFIFPIPVNFIHSTILVSKHYFVFISLIYILHIFWQSFKKAPPSLLLSGVIP